MIIWDIVEMDQGALRHEAALGLATFFVCYFRPTEGAEVKEEDLVLSLNNEDSHAINLHPASRGEQSKVGVCDETFALDSQELPELGAALAYLKTGQPKARRFKLSKHQLRAYWNRALVRLEIKELKLNLYAIRHCGPSHDRRKKYRGLAEVKKRGRWISDKSMARYEAHARVVQEFQKFSVNLQQKARASATKVRAYINQKAKGL